MNKELIKENKLIRKNRPIIPANVLYSIYENNGVFQICFKSKGCSNYLNGLCIMCDYGVGTNITKEELAKAFDLALSESKEKIRTLLLNSYGSVLDQKEISNECLEVLLNKVAATNIKNIIFETYYTTITREKLELIKNKLPDKNIIFEFGLETANEKIREKCLLKYINNKHFLKTVELVHSYGMEATANIIVGIPFLSSKDQLNDALESIDWCFNNNIDEVNLFPMNIRPYTLLEKLYKEGKYQLISHWLLIEVLANVKTDYLKDIYIAWYGNRDLNYDGNIHSLFPTSCPLCQDDLANFYKNYLGTSDSNYRKELINNLIKNKKCDC